MNVIPFNQCEKIRRSLDAYLDNELLVETNQEILRHLSACTECTDLLNQRARLKQAVKHAVDAEPVPESLAAAIQANLEQRRGAWLFTIPQWALAAVLILMVAGGMVALRTRLFKRPASSAALEQVMQIGLIDHVRCALMLENWKHFVSFEHMSQETGTAALGPDFINLVPLVAEKIGPAFHVVQGHRCVVDNRQYVHIILTGDNGSILSLVITLKDGASLDRAGVAATLKASGVPIYQGQEDQLQIRAFETGRYLAFLVSNLDSSNSTNVANTLARPVYDFLHRLEL